VRIRSGRRKLQSPVQGFQVVGERQIDPAVVVDQDLKGTERDHG